MAAGIYTRKHDHAGDVRVSGQKLNAELDAVASASSQQNANLKKIQRDDGELKDGVVKLTSLSNEVIEAKFKGERGDAGASAYEIWLQLGNIGSEEDYYLSLKGNDGKVFIFLGTATWQQISAIQSASIGHAYYLESVADAPDPIGGFAQLNDVIVYTEGGWINAGQLKGDDGDDGNNGWTPVFSIESDETKDAIRITDWIGGGGQKPATGVYIGQNSYVGNFADAKNIKGGNGSNGIDGWSPIFAIVPDGAAREVMRVVDWIGGEGSKPAVGAYIGDVGFVNNIAQARNLRGTDGIGGGGSGLPTIASMAQLQSAISAASAAGGGIIRCTAGFGFTGSTTIPDKVTVDFGSFTYTLSSGAKIIQTQRSVTLGGIFNFIDSCFEFQDCSISTSPINANSWFIGSNSNTGTAVLFDTVAKSMPCSFVRIFSPTIKTCKRGLDFNGYGAGAFSNSNKILGLKMYECLEMITLSAFSSENRIEGTIQPRSNLNIGKWAIKSDGNQNFFEIGVWDYAELTSTDGYAAKLGANDTIITNIDPKLITSEKSGRERPTVISYGFRNSSVNNGFSPPMNKIDGDMVGSQDDGLAYAVDRYTVSTTGGTAPTTSQLKRMFDPANTTACAFTAATSHSITIDLLVSMTGGLKAFGILFDTPPTGSVKLQKSGDGLSWTDVEVFPAMPRPHCYLSDRSALTGAFRFLKVLTTNTASEIIEVRRVYAAWFGASGAWLPVTTPSGGANGWTPTLAVRSDGERRVLQVIDWIGGSGTKPTSGQYIGLQGLVAGVANAVDIRGSSGIDGINGTNGVDGNQSAIQFNDQTGSYTLVPGDIGKIVRINNAAATTVTVPSGLATGFHCMVKQVGAGAVSIAGGAGMTRRNRLSHTKTAGQYSTATLFVDSSSEFTLQGDTAL